MKNIKLLISFFVFLPLITAAQGLDFTTVATPVFCVNDGSITVTVSNEVGHVQYELVNYSGITVRSVIGIPQDNPVFLNLAPGTYTVGVYDDNNGTTPITKQVVVPNNGPEKTLTISNVFSTRLAYCGTDSDPGALMWVIPNGGAAPYTVTVLDTNDVVVREAVSSGSQSFPAMPAGTYKIRVKDNCGTVVNSNSPFVIAPNIVYDFTVSTPTNWYWPGAIQVTHDSTGSICDPVSDAYYDFSYAGGIGIPVITGNDVYPISLAPGITPMYAVEYDGIKTAYMTRDELRTYKHPLPTDINSWKPMTLWVSNCGVEKSTVYNLPSRRNDFLPKPIENGAITFYVADDAANTLCAPTGYVTLSRFSLLSGFCDPLTLTITEKNGAELPQQYTITSANQNDFQAQLALGNTYILKFTDANGSELNRFSYINITRGQRVNLNSRSEIFIDPVNFRPANQDELSVELGSMADFKNFGRSQIGIRDYALPKPYTVAITGPNGFYMEKIVVKSDSFVGTLLSDNLVLGDYSVRVTSAATCYDKTFPITLDRVIDSISVTSTITPDPVACDRYIKTFEYKINNRGILRPYPTNAFEDVFKAPQLGFKVIDGPAGYTHTNAIVFNSAYSWGMSSTPEVTATFRGDITGLYKINLVDYYTPTNVIGGPWELNVKSEFPVFDMNGSGGAICTGATTGTLSVVVKNATSPVYYLKKASDANYPATGQSSSDFPNLTAGDYMVKVETACYPTALETNFKMDYISNIGNIIQGTNDLCDSDALNLSLKSIGPITAAEWKLPDGTTQTGSTLVISNPQAGQYSVKVTTRSGCVVTDVIEVKLKNRAVLADVLATDKTICSGETTTLQATSTTITNPLFTWYSDAGLTNVLSTGADYNTPVLTANTTYYVTVQNADICESIPAEARAVAVTLNPSATATDITADAVDTCFDDTATLNADSTTITNPIFTWYSDADLTDVLGVGASFTTPELTTDKSYYVTVKGDNVCENLPGTAKEVHVTVHPALVVTPPTPQITGNQCVFPEINFDSNSAGTLYVWSVDDWTIGLEDNWISSPNMPSFTAINTGTQPVTATVTVHPIGTYCGAGSFTFTITVNPDIVLTKPADIKVCNDNIVSEINFDSNITGTTYSWTNDNPRIGLATVGTGNIPAFTASNTGDSSEIATITVTPTASGCSGTPVVFTIEVNPAGAMNKIADQNICIGETTILTASSATVINPVFTWYSDAALTNVLAVDAAYNANPLVTTTYYVTVKGENACETTTGMPVVVRVSDAGTPTGSAAQEFCSASNALVSDLVTNESNVTWYDAANGGNVISAGTALVN
ncbi:PKD-like domain-containing protein, partial [Flavobacterium sp. YO12]|uniref:immunoglobulin domain-containing protein n=1 Tax=Flavobacterium sp. YO12 TaxID=1920029 RepID=UPI001027C2E3